MSYSCNTLFTFNFFYRSSLNLCYWIKKNHWKKEAKRHNCILFIKCSIFERSIFFIGNRRLSINAIIIILTSFKTLSLALWVVVLWITRILYIKLLSHTLCLKVKEEVGYTKERRVKIIYSINIMILVSNNVKAYWQSTQI